MKRLIYFLCIFILITTYFFSCKKADRYVHFDETTLPTALIEYLKAEGYSTNNIIPYKDGYIVEGDIIITKTEFTKTISRNVQPSEVTNLSNKRIIAGTIAQYRTTNIISVTGGTRTISVALSNANGNFPNGYLTALDAALARYNSVSNFGLNFIRVTDNANITITVDNSFPWYIYGGANGLGFPDNGNPNSTIGVHVAYISDVSNNNPDQGFLTTFLAHEIGHCIGFRHTDYMNRNFSCPYEPPGVPELDPNNVGAVHIPGTPTTADANSWMLACMSPTTNRPFNTNDITALQTVYPPTVASFNVTVTKVDLTKGYSPSIGFTNAITNEFVKSIQITNSSGSYTIPNGTYNIQITQTNAKPLTVSTTSGSPYLPTQTGSYVFYNNVTVLGSFPNLSINNDLNAGPCGFTGYSPFNIGSSNLYTSNGNAIGYVAFYFYATLNSGVQYHIANFECAWPSSNRVVTRTIDGRYWTFTFLTNGELWGSFYGPVINSAGTSTTISFNNFTYPL